MKGTVLLISCCFSTKFYSLFDIRFGWLILSGFVLQPLFFFSLCVSVSGLCLVQVQNKQLTVSGKIFAITSQRGATKNILKLGVNFQTEIIQLAKEVRPVVTEVMENT